MQLEPQTLESNDLYKLLSGCVVPRSSAWVSTVDAEGVAHVAPVDMIRPTDP